MMKNVGFVLLVGSRLTFALSSADVRCSAVTSGDYPRAHIANAHTLNESVEWRAIFKSYPHCATAPAASHL